CLYLPELLRSQQHLLQLRRRHVARHEHDDGVPPGHGFRRHTGGNDLRAGEQQRSQRSALVQRRGHRPHQPLQHDHPPPPPSAPPLRGAAVPGAAGEPQADLTVNGGSGYVGAPLVQFSSVGVVAGGTPAAGYALISGGSVVGIVITSPGTYTPGTTPTITLFG